MIKNEIALVTWTHNEYSDIWPSYFGCLEKHVKFNNSYIFLDKKSVKISDNHIQAVNDDSQPYYKRFLNSLSRVKEDFIIYLQEDHLFYSDCHYDELDRCFEILKNNNVSNIRLIKSGELGGNKIEECIYKIPQSSNYLFSQQSAIWKKKDLINLLNFYKPRTYRDVEANGSVAMNNLNLKTYYYFNNENKRGSLHHDSSVFPYIATAVCKGKWNLNQYPILLKKILEEYDIDYSVRGIYNG